MKIAPRNEELVAPLVLRQVQKACSHSIWKTAPLSLQVMPALFLQA